MYLLIACILGVMVIGLGRSAEWNWFVTLGMAAVPVVFPLFLGLYGILIGGLFVGALFKATK